MRSTDDSNDVRIYATLFAIDENAFAFWEQSTSTVQVRFLQSINPQYFDYVATVNANQLDTENANHAAAAIRIVYSQALECLFALIGSALQAPECPAGWMLKYQVRDLESLISKITQYKPFLSRLQIGRLGWDGVTQAILKLDPEQSGASELVAAFAQLWRSLAYEFIEKDFQAEYNSLKHGLRVQSGPWQFAIGREDVPGVRAPSSRMRLMANSQFGSNFFRPIFLKPHQQFHFGEQRVNWNPHLYAKRIPLIVASIQNVIVTLLAFQGVATHTLGYKAITEELTNDAWNEGSLGNHAKFGHQAHISPSDLPDISRIEILQSYNDGESG